MATQEAKSNRSESRARTLDIKPWTLPLIVAAIIVPVVIGFVVGGPLFGVVLGFVAAAVIALIAATQRPGGTIESPPGEDRRRHVLVVVSHELDDPKAVDRFKRGAQLVDGDGDAKVRVLAPAQTRLLDKWATDVEAAREEAQRKLAVSVASLKKANVAAEGALGAETIVQAVEDELRSFPATHVALITGSPDADPEGAAAARELEGRLQPALLRITLDESAR